MVRSTEIIEKIQHALSKEEWLIIEAPILELKSQQVRKARKTLIGQINHIIIETSLKNDRPRILMALPDIGINYQTMTVTQAKKLIAAGMKNAENGDRITMSVSKEKKLIFFKNLRTNEELSYPPERPLERSR